MVRNDGVLRAALKGRKAAKSAAKPTTGKPAAKQKTKTTPPALAQEHIAARAYQIWIDQGQPTGQDQTNWTQAETELSQAA